MNERIKELAEQADEYADTKLQMPGEYHPDWHDVRDEKFAELIVRECIRAASTTPEMRKSGAPERIKEVLGVE